MKRLSLPLPLWLILFLLTLVLTGCSSLPTVSPRPAHWATPVHISAVENFYRLDAHLYRSAQPSKKGMQALEQFDIKTVLNLRYFHSDKAVLRGTSLQSGVLPMLPYDISPKKLTQALQIIRQSPKPLLVHCQYGADRTGAVIAAYRIVEQGWSKEEAIREMQYGGYGYHYLLFPNIREVLHDLDVEAVRRSLRR